MCSCRFSMPLSPVYIDGNPLREALVVRRGLSRQFPFSHLQHLLWELYR